MSKSSIARSCLCLAMALVSELSAAQEAGRESWRSLPLPALCASPPPLRVPPALADGVHLLRSTSSLEPRLASGAALIPIQLLETLLARSLEEAGAGASVQADVGAILLRGDEAAFELVRAELASLEAQAARLTIELEVELLAAGRDAPLLAHAVRLHSGQEVVLGERQSSSYLAGYDAHVAADSAVADPRIAQLWTGSTLHLSAVRLGGGARVHVSGLLDVAERVADAEPTFDAGLADYETIQLPVLDLVQVAFAGSVGPEAALTVELTGTHPSWSSLKLVIRARTRADAAPPAGHWQTLDVSALAQSTRDLDPASPGHGLELEGDAAAPQSRGGLAPASLVGLALRGGAAGARPLWTDQLVLLPPQAQALGPALSDLARTLEESRFREGMLELRSAELTVRLPCTEGYPARVLVGRESALVVDYGVEIAPETWMAEPVVARRMDGVCLDARVRAGQVQASSWMTRSVALPELASEGGAVGRLQLPQRGIEAAQATLQPGQEVRLLPQVRALYTPSPP